MKYIIALSGLLFWAPLAAQESQLIVFTQSEQDTLFINNYLTDVKAIAEKINSEFIVLEASAGMPEDLTTTPAIVFQNARGRSLYAARYAESSTLKNFVRTARVVPQKSGVLPKENTLIYQDGRAKITAPVKITEPKGAVPTDFDFTAFKTKAMQAINEGMPRYEQRATSKLQRSDRQFYMDFHPYFSKDGAVFLSLALYSQFSCIVPVFEEFETPLQGEMSKYDCLFEKAAKIMDKEIEKQLKSSKIGDAYTPVPIETAVKTWENLGLELPEASANATFTDTDLTIKPGAWTVTGAIDEQTPLIQFRFAEPLERYAGEVKKMEGSLILSPEGKISSGDFTVPVKSLTMGIESFDAKIFKSYLKASKYPEASFRFTEISGHEPLVFGQATTVIAEGIFKLKNKKKRLPVNAVITPIVDAAGNPQLSCSVDFQLNITDDFGIQGPDGPEPNRKLMEFNLNFLLNNAQASLNTSSAATK